jgi:hypothetical protein
MREKIGVFKRESALVEHICSILDTGESPWGNLSVRTEFSILNGKPDVIAIDSNNRVIAFEAKLSKWRDALSQAYRNSSFAEESYVILPKETAKSAIEYEGEFRVRSVGLCSVTSDSIEILIEPQPSELIQPWINRAAIIFVSQKSENG